MLDELKTQVLKANLDLVKAGVVIRTFGNASGIDRAQGLVVIKPSGVPYEKLAAKQMVVVALDSGEVIEGGLHPSSDTPTHLELYRAFPGIGGIVHTHSLFATAWAQTGRELPALGTTHADYFCGPVPCTRLLKPREVESDYEANTGRVIVQTFARRDPLSCPAVLVASHGPFAWGQTPAAAVENAVVLEHLARLAGETLRIFPSVRPVQRVLMEKHFLRKHGPGAYYGQGPAAKTDGNRHNKQ